MGQYYSAVLLADDADDIVGYVDPWDYGISVKLMEHSWIGDRFVEAVERLLSEPTRVVWAGHYADIEPGGVKPENLYDRSDSAAMATVSDSAVVGRYVINHDKRVYVDKDVVAANNGGLRMHPLPILTVEGNGRGGGDLHPQNTAGDLGFEAVGSWARDRITVGDAVPDDYEQLHFDLIEHW
ncbi:hypothetical protein ACFZC5_17735 [Nocardia gamkensis]|uniref:hypothetical protein n=1 Tax=Nocardia gamkensis TaxID=352869 RepID=UPI0036EC6115